MRKMTHYFVAVYILEIMQQNIWETQIFATLTSRSTLAMSYQVFHTLHNLHCVQISTCFSVIVPFSE